MRALLISFLTLAATAFAGCIDAPADGALDSGADDGVAPMLPLGPQTTEIPGDIVLSTATPAMSFNYGGAFRADFEKTANLTGVVVELEWDASSPLSESLDVWVRDAAAGTIPPSDPTDLANPVPPIASATGTSPLRLVVPAADFPADGAYTILVRAATPAGAAVAQPFVIHFTTFEDVAFDAEYSAFAPTNETGA